MSTTSAAKTAPPAEPPGAFTFNDLKNGTTGFGIVLACANGVTVGHYFGLAWSLIWIAAATSLLIATSILSARRDRGDSSVLNRLGGLHLAMISVWMVSAIALWLTGHQAAWVIATIIPASWAIHIIFVVRGNLADMRQALTICVVPIVAFLLHAVWSHFPVWVAIAGTVSSLAMVASIGAENGARQSDAQASWLRARPSDNETRNSRDPESTQTALLGSTSEQTGGRADCEMMK